MSYIVKTINGDDNKELRKINEILNSIIDKEEKNKIEDFIEKLEEKGFVICKKVNLDK
jgi:hypothetical protein